MNICHDMGKNHKYGIWKLVKPFFGLVAIFFFKWKYNEIVAFKKLYQTSAAKFLVILIFCDEYLSKYREKDKYSGSIS